MDLAEREARIEQGEDDLCAAEKRRAADAAS
jgi:hypothetical protein